MTRLKICGLRELSHALAAADAGADFLGFVFVPGVRRELQEDQARGIIQRYRDLRGHGGPTLVGLFANQPVDEVNRVVRYCGLDMVQLCGDEPPEYWQEVEWPIIKQVRVREDGPVQEVVSRVIERVEAVVSRGHICLLDRHEEGTQGGTGRSFNWDIARDVARRYPFILAGGLTPANVGDAVNRVRPWGVDVSSGVETNGVKDVGKIAAFAAEVCRAEENVNDSKDGRRISFPRIKSN